MKVISKLITTSLGVGFLPVAPGTWGAAFGALLLYIFMEFGIYSSVLLGALIVFFTLISVPLINILEEEWGEDPSKVVIDETVGLWLTMLFIPFNLTNLLIAFVLFRFFDILKPLGIRYFDKMQNGWGVMLDDILAGIYANVILQLIVHFIL